MPKTQSNLPATLQRIKRRTYNVYRWWMDGWTIKPPFFGRGGELKFQVASNDILLQKLKPGSVSPESWYFPSLSESDCFFLIHSKTAQVGWPGENKKVLCAAPRLSEEDMKLFTVVSLKKWPSVGTRGVKSSWQFTMDAHMARPKLRAHNIGAQHDDPPPSEHTLLIKPAFWPV